MMLTHNDYTVENAEEIFETGKNTKAKYWGMKEKPLPLERMKALFARMRDCGKTTALEVVGYDEEAALEGVDIAVECGCDLLMGTSFFPAVADKCHRHGLSYFPFIGNIEGRPSVLKGSVDEITREALDAITHGADGIDLLGYRYVGDADMLIREVDNDTPAPVVVAGSIDTFERLARIKQLCPWGFTIGSAFFENKFGGTFAEQIDKVCDYLRPVEP